MRRTTLGAVGYGALVAAGILLASPFLTLGIPSCPPPSGHFFFLGIAAGLVAAVCFWLDERR